MTIKKTKRVMILPILLIISLTTNINKVTAADTNIGSAENNTPEIDNMENNIDLSAIIDATGKASNQQNNQNNPSEDETSTPANSQTTNDFANDENWTTTCTWYNSTSEWSKVYASAYDTNGNRINDILNIQESLNNQNLNNLLAGRFIGLNIYEKKGYTTTVKYEVTSTIPAYTCSYCAEWKCVEPSIEDSNSNHIEPSIEDSKFHIVGPLSNKMSNNNTIQIKLQNCTCVNYGSSTVYSSSACSGEITETNSDSRTPTSEEISWCKNLANPADKTLSSSYQVSYKDSNDINATDSNDKYYTAATVTGTGTCEHNSPTYTVVSSTKEMSTGEITKTGNCTFTYNREKTCINVKNGKVRYVTDDTNCNEDEYEISSNKNYWNYFIPLNTKSSEGFSFTMNSSGSIVDSKICENIIEKYQTDRGYMKRITPINSTFTTNEGLVSAKAKVANGCYYQTYITIPVEQKFYNEINNGTAFKGFNFYYKPIDINNPFPNDVGTTSLWNDWSNSGKDNPDLTESYSEITYEAINISVSKVRNYNENNTYTSWENMTYRGISNFIENEGIVTRITDKNNIYVLGCGPANENQYLDEAKTIKNPLYQKECDNS